MKKLALLMILAMLASAGQLLAGEPEYVDEVDTYYLSKEECAKGEEHKAGWYLDFVLLDSQGQSVAADGEVDITVYDPEEEGNPHGRKIFSKRFVFKKHNFHRHGRFKHRPFHGRVGPFFVPQRRHNLFLHFDFHGPRGHIIKRRHGKNIIVIHPRRF